MRTLIPAITASFVALLLACYAGDHPEGALPHGEAHGNGHGRGTEAITHYAEETELFVEFPALVVGEESAFAAHLTRLSDFRPVDVGRVVVALSGGGAAEERFTVSGPSVPGIFRPVAHPQQSGSRRLSLRLESGALADLHDLGVVAVFADGDAAARAASHAAVGDRLRNRGGGRASPASVARCERDAARESRW